MSEVNGHPVMGSDDYLRGYNDALTRCRQTLQAAFNEADYYRDVLHQLEDLVMDDWLRDMIRASLGRQPEAS